MADPTQIQRIAAAVNELRPEWPVRSLVTYLTKNHADRPFADLAIACVAVAVDERSATPARVAEHGPWWVAAYQASRTPTPTVGPGAEPRCEKPGHEHELARNCRCCASERIAVRDEEES